MDNRKADRGGYKSNATLEEKIMMSIVRTAELYKKKIGAIFLDHGLTFPQYNVLRILEASTNGENTISNVSRMMLVSGANMTGIAKRLEKNGFLKRKGDANDERITLLEITEKGRTSIKKIHDKKESNLQAFVSATPENINKKDLLETLKQISLMMMEK